MKYRIMRWLGVIACSLIALVFLGLFGYMIHLANLCLEADRAVKAVIPDFSTKWDWLAYLSCCTPLGFAVIWTVRSVEAIQNLRRY
jgi:hypothetical protein